MLAPLHHSERFFSVPKLPLQPNSPYHRRNRMLTLHPRQPLKWFGPQANPKQGLVLFGTPLRGYTRLSASGCLRRPWAPFRVNTRVSPTAMVRSADSYILECQDISCNHECSHMSTSQPHTDRHRHKYQLQSLPATSLLKLEGEQTHQARTPVTPTSDTTAFE